MMKNRIDNFGIYLIFIFCNKLQILLIYYLALKIELKIGMAAKK